MQQQEEEEEEEEETHTEMRFQKKLRSTSAWVLCCKFAADLLNTFLEERLFKTFLKVVFIL